ncbi:MAG: hypothetical protein LIP02_04535 [Bacteroidales bacterium]|nr:hypothetical protein [Bacteroidales bacterium]
MALLSNLKRAFGFGAEDEVIDMPGIDATVHPFRTLNGTQFTPEDNPDNPTDKTPVDTPQPLAPSPEASPARFLNPAVDTINRLLPEFMRQAIDTERERDIIYAALDQGLKDYLKGLDENARRQSRLSWDRDRARLDEDISSLKAKIKAMEEKADEGKKLQLSAERQKRALAERVHDLEGQVATLEAEKEQFELENKSLLNKIRLASVLEADNPYDNTDTAAAPEGDTALQRSCDKAQEEITALNKQLEQVKAELEKAQTSLQDTEKQRDEAVAKNEIADAMINDLQARLAESQKAREALEQEITEARSAMEAIDSIQQEVDKFNEIKTAKDKQINELSAENDRLTAIIQSLKDDNEQMRHTIEANLATHAESEASLRAQIAALQESAEKAKAEAIAPEKPQRAPRKSRKPQEPLDDLLDDTDWLLPGAPAGKTLVAETDTQFGYQEPPRKIIPDNDAQLSLF